MKTQLQIKWLLPVLLLTIVLISSGACSDDSINWKEEIIGSTFNNFETILYVGDIPATVDRQNSVYLYHSGESESTYVGYFQYKKSPSDKEYTAYLLNKSPIIDAFLEDLIDTSKEIPILFSGTIYGANQLTIGSPAESFTYSLSITSIKKK